MKHLSRGSPVIIASIHATTDLKLLSEDFCATDIPEEDEEINDSVNMLSTNPFLAIAHCGSYGLVSKATKVVHSLVAIVITKDVRISLF